MFRQICVFVRQNITVQKRNIMKNILSSLFVFSVVVYTTKDSGASQSLCKPPN